MKKYYIVYIPMLISTLLLGISYGQNDTMNNFPDSDSILKQLSIIKNNYDHFINRMIGIENKIRFSLQEYEDIEKQINLIIQKIDSIQRIQIQQNINLNTLDINTKSEISDIEKQDMIKVIIPISIFFCLIFLIVLYIIIKIKKKIIDMNEIIELHSRITSLIENQLAKSTGESESIESLEINHLFIIDLCNEIFRIQKRISNMDKAVKGLNAIDNTIIRLMDLLGKQGYIIKDLTDTEYYDGLTVKVINTFERVGVDPGKKIIARMISPQIYYNNKIISPGEIEIAVAPKNS